VTAEVSDGESRAGSFLVCARTLEVAQISCVPRLPPASKISGNQFIGAPASANIDAGCGGTYQITVAIERVQKAQFIGLRIRLNSPQGIFAYKE
jgi:hypothetical protein